MSVRARTTRRAALAAALLATGVVVALAAIGLTGSSGGSTAGPSGLPIAKTDPSVVIEGVTLDGMPLSVDELLGRPIFVTVWASW